VVDSRTPPEVDRVAASRRAVEARRARASLKRDLSTRVLSGQEVLRRAVADPASAAGTLRVPEFLTALPAIGEGKRDRVLAELGISPVKRLGGLGVRQRAALQEWLDGRLPEPQPRAARSRLLVLAGPTAVGKGTVAAHIQEHYPEIVLSVSATTRPPRPGEIDGTHYFFVDDAAFDELIERGELLEWATGPQQVPIRHASRSDRERTRRRPHRFCSRSICRAPGRSGRRRPMRHSCSCSRPAGMSSCSALSVEVRRMPRSARGDCARRGWNWRPRASSTIGS